MQRSLPAIEIAMQEFFSKHCVACHEVDNASGSFAITQLPDLTVTQPVDVASWEKVLKRIRSRQMPPPDATRPSEQEYVEAIESIDQALHQVANANPNPGSPPTLRRLTRAEYESAIRDLLGVTIDASQWIPSDQSSHGFDNITVTELTPTLINRYLTAAQQISRMAVASTQRNPQGLNVRVPADRTQEEHVEGLPLGTRGGVLVNQYFPLSGQYEFQIKLARDRDETVEGLTQAHEIHVLVDDQLAHIFNVEPPKVKDDYTLVDAHLIVRLQVPAGHHAIGVTFPDKSNAILEIKRQPFDASFNRHRHPRPNPAIFEVAIVGPFEPIVGTATQSRLAIFGEAAKLGKVQGDAPEAEALFRRVMRKAYRRSILASDLDQPMAFYRKARQNGDFEAGIEAGLASILVNPNFLIKIERSSSDFEQPILPLSDYELASRLSFFLWSSLPDDELLRCADAGKLSQEDTLTQQVERMLKDPKADALTTNFATQWLYLKNLDSISPDMRSFPDFDDNLRSAMKKETQLLFAEIVREDKSVLTLLTSDHVYLNERLATHYGIQGVLGSHFRKVNLEANSLRGGLLRNGSILTVTSYANRTSPTIRGNWILENILGTPPPPPPPNIPALKDKDQSKALTVRDRLAAHREDPNCAGCHNLMDPIGFALENYDAVGRWRNFEGDAAIDTSGILPDGTAVSSVQDLEKAILKHQDLFVETMTKKLLTYAIGRGMEPSDGATIRTISKYASENGYRFSSLIRAIVLSDPFLKRSTHNSEVKSKP